MFRYTLTLGVTLVWATSCKPADSSKVAGYTAEQLAEQGEAGLPTQFHRLVQMVNGRPTVRINLFFTPEKDNGSAYIGSGGPVPIGTSTLGGSGSGAYQEYANNSVGYDSYGAADAAVVSEGSPSGDIPYGIFTLTENEDLSLKAYDQIVGWLYDPNQAAAPNYEQQWRAAVNAAQAQVQAAKSVPGATPQSVQAVIYQVEQNLSATRANLERLQAQTKSSTFLSNAQLRETPSYGLTGTGIYKDTRISGTGPGIGSHSEVYYDIHLKVGQASALAAEFGREAPGSLAMFAGHFDAMDAAQVEGEEGFALYGSQVYQPMVDAFTKSNTADKYTLAIFPGCGSEAIDRHFIPTIAGSNGFGLNGAGGKVDPIVFRGYHNYNQFGTTFTKLMGFATNQGATTPTWSQVLTSLEFADSQPAIGK